MGLQMLRDMVAQPILDAYHSAVDARGCVSARTRMANRPRKSMRVITIKPTDHVTGVMIYITSRDIIRHK